VADRTGGQVLYVSDEGDRAATATGVVAEPLDLAAADGGGCWVADRAGGALVRVGRDCDVLERRDLGLAVTGVSEEPGTGALWITVSGAGEVRRIDPNGETSRLYLDGCPRRIAVDVRDTCGAPDLEPD
jgi:hypothetical protein